MSDVMKWEVVREHEGDRFYREGEFRFGTKADLGHLAPKVLRLVGPGNAKAEPAPLNKAEGAAPANKASTGRKGRKS